MQKNRLGFLYNHYHWIIATVLLLMIFVHGGSMNNFSTLHLIPITEKLNISRADFALAYSVKNIMGMVSTFFSGFIISRLGSRITAPLGMLCLGASYVITSNANSLPLLALGCGMLGASYGFCTTAGAVVVVRLWFHRHEGAVLGLVSAASGLGGSLLSMVQTAAMETGSYQDSLNLCAILAFAMAAVLLLLLRNKPEDMGLLPLGEGERTKKRPQKTGFSGLPMKALWRQPAFYLLLLCVVLYSFSLYLSFNVIRNYFVDCGFSPVLASGLYSAMMLLMTLTKLFSGMMCDRLGSRRVNIICLVCAVAGLVLLILVQNLAVAIVAIIIYTVALPLLTLIGPLVAFDLFGYRAQTQYTGILLAMVSLANLFGNYLTNWIYDRFQSYKPSFALAAVLAAVTILLFLLLYRMTDRLKAATQE